MINQINYEQLSVEQEFSRHVTLGRTRYMCSSIVQLAIMNIILCSKYIISIVELTNEVTFGYAIFNVRIELGKIGSHHFGHHRWILGKGSTSIMDNRYGVDQEQN